MQPAQITHQISTPDKADADLFFHHQRNVPNIFSLSSLSDKLGCFIFAVDTLLVEVYQESLDSCMSM